MQRIALYISLALVALSCSRSNVYPMVEGEVSIAYLRSLADERSQCIKGDIWIKGDVVHNDKLGERYKSFVVYDGTAGVDVKVDFDYVDVVVPLYSEVRLRCEGLYIGREGERIVLGAEPTAEYVVDRISENELANRLDILILCDRYHVAQSIAVGDIGFDDMLSCVCVDGVKVVSEEDALAWCDVDATERPFDSSLRHFVSGRDTLTVATLNRCDYAAQRMPDDIVTLFGVIDSYNGEVVLRLSDMGCTPH